MKIKQLIGRYVRGKIKFVSFRRQFRQFSLLSQQNEARFPLRWEDRLPCLFEQTAVTAFDRHYIYHPAWAARIVNRLKPMEHTDISSTLHFCTILSAFVPVRFYDYRPAELNLPNLISEHADLIALPFEDNSILSLSCMHTVEHIGLGRYGDQIDPLGDLKAMKELRRVLAPGGSLLFVVPIGQPKILFNAHRIYSYGQIAEYFAEMELVEFSLLPDDPQQGGLLDNATREITDAQSYGCGCFWFRKPIA